MKIEKYVRTFEQDEELGINDMKTEGYSEAEKWDGYKPAARGSRLDKAMIFCFVIIVFIQEDL